MTQKQSWEDYKKENPPTRETEMLRIWKVDPKEENKTDLIDKHDIPVNFGTGKDKMTFHLCGYNQLHTKDTKKLVFAYKFKHEDKMVMYYIPDDISIEDKRKIMEALAFLKDMCERMGYECRDSRDWMKSSQLEAMSLLKEEKDKENKNENKKQTKTKKTKR